MKVVHELKELRALLGQIGSTSFVPTMGNLHQGHLSLVDRAASFGAPVVVSIFVNPLQFAPHEDFNSYPRTLDDDVAKLRDHAVDVVFAPTVGEMYAETQSFFVQPPEDLANQLEGAARPGFFTGVATVVLKLFNMVQPRRAIFGAKDLQQVRVVEAMCRQFALPIEIVTEPTARAEDGLALSSRNGYLSAAERAQAARLFKALNQVADALRKMDTWDGATLAKLETAAADELRTHGWSVDYIAIRQGHDLAPPALIDRHKLVVLGAARLGRTRLIDNLEV